jgi:hypothetical protein
MNSRSKTGHKTNRKDCVLRALLCRRGARSEHRHTVVLLGQMSKVKKTFEKPGQTMEHDETTPDGPGVKIFYETLLQQRPDSAMAAEWLLKRGLLEDDVAKMWLNQLGKDKKALPASKPAPKRKARPGSQHQEMPAPSGQPVGPLRALWHQPPAPLRLQASADDFDSSPAQKGTGTAAPAKKKAAKKDVEPDSSDVRLLTAGNDWWLPVGRAADESLP